MNFLEIIELKDLFKRVSEITSKYPNITNDELYELKPLADRLHRECSDAIYDIEWHEKEYKFKNINEGLYGK